MSVAIVQASFEGHAVTVVTFRGRHCWMAPQVGEALGYTKAGFRSALRDWSDELIEGTDYDVLTGAELREFKELLDVSAKFALSRAPNLTIVYEPGLHLVCLKTNMPAGRRMRRFLADEVMPRLMRREPILPVLDEVRAELRACAERSRALETRNALLESKVLVLEGAHAAAPATITALEHEDLRRQQKEIASKLVAGGKSPSLLSAHRTIRNDALSLWNGSNRQLAGMPRWLLPAVLTDLRRLRADADAAIAAGGKPQPKEGKAKRKRPAPTPNPRQIPLPEVH